MNNDDTAVGDENLLPTALTKLTLDWLEFTLTQTSGGGAIALDIKYCKSAETLERERVRNSLRQSIAIGCSGAQDGNLLDAAAQTASDLEAALFRAYYFAHEAVYHSKVRALYFRCPGQHRRIHLARQPLHEARVGTQVASD